ncbi:Gfo/Idh/MocA family oxidoreductase [Magnetospirillum sp. 15-1]|uniref:Gfo/Idh/MocA family protein n=1 Tax=Magnetospirillum sp. 15-1 TaxID=1979370 RepID=UPI000BBBAA97|nr:Gfo/Idh/MocA family oxidoreductase [Magnetospirillum sp. 15-1]
MIGVAVVGLGYWGPNLVRNVLGNSRMQLVAICDYSSENLQRMAAKVPGIMATTNFEDLLSNPQIDALIIATSVMTHYELAIRALKTGKHVLVEKPMAHSAECAARLIEEADKKNLIIMVDHTFVYTSAVRKIKELVDSDDIGQIHYYDSVRINLGIFQSDVNVIWDLAVHDFSIMDYIFGRAPVQISAIARSHVPGQPDNMAYVTALYSDGLVAHCHVNWMAPMKVRTTLIGGARKMIVYNDIQSDEKIKIYNKGVSVDSERTDLRINYRSGDMHAPMLDNVEALSRVIEAFADAIERKAVSPTAGQCGLRVVKMLEAASISAKRLGEPVTPQA